MRNERRHVTVGEFGEAVLEQIRRAGVRQASDQEIVERADADGHTRLDVAIPFRVRVRIPPDFPTGGRLAQGDPCCVCLQEGDGTTCLGTCCR